MMRQQGDFEVFLYFCSKLIETTKAIMRNNNTAPVNRIVLFLSIALLCSIVSTAKADNEWKPRLVVCTDIAPADVEPDDMESMVRLMAYADLFEIEAIITTVGWNCDPYPAEWAAYLQRVLNAYGKDVKKLMKRSTQKGFLPKEQEDGRQRLGYWPSVGYLKSRAVMGSQHGGIKAIGPDNDTPGSNLLIRLADEADNRPIYVAAWGGANTLAQAIWRVKQTRTAAEVKQFVRKFRIYTITDQDMQYSMRMNRAYSSHQWLRQEFADDLQFVWDEGTWQEQCDLGKQHWQQHASHIQGKGALGKEYPNYKWGVEGDTPSFLYVMPNGLNNPDDPRQAGWAGYHERGLCPDSLTTAWTSWQEPVRSVSIGYKRRFYPDELGDFIARMEWADKGKGNHNPIVVVDADTIRTKAGATIQLDASASSDPDGDTLNFLWWQQPEIGTGQLLISTPNKATTNVTIPAHSQGQTFHLICEVHDNGPHHLVAYRRMVVVVENEVVSTTSGRVSGIIQEGTMAWLGIPYAKVERFMPPLPVEKWDGVRACDHWGPQTMQPTNRPMSEAEMSEQCCVLNVWTTDVKGKKPVMLWLHGGGFDSGTSAWDPGMQLAKKDVVVVSVNHRLNILGFLDLSAVSNKYKYSGNVGMLDVVQALKWIRDNIAHFGGDPTNVTVFGESGGGGKVGTLMCMPAAKGLFHKAIIMSGTILNVNTQEMTQTLGKAVLKELGISENDVDRIKDVPYRQLYDAGQRAMASSIGTRRPGTPMMWGFGPTPDGETLLQQPFQPAFASISDDIPLIIGTTFNELQRQRYNQPITLDEARAELQRTFENDTEAYIEAFKEAYPTNAPERLAKDLLSIDWLFRPKTIITADAIGGKRKADTYVYLYTVEENDRATGRSKGSAHGAELKCCFNVLHHYADQLSEETMEKNKQWADIMSSVWARFAHDATPGVSLWHPYTKENGEVLVFGGTWPQTLHHHDRKLNDIINRHCFKQLDAFKANVNKPNKR